MALPRPGARRALSRCVRHPFPRCAQRLRSLPDGRSRGDPACRSSHLSLARPVGPNRTPWRSHLPAIRRAARHRPLGCRTRNGGARQHLARAPHFLCPARQRPRHALPARHGVARARRGAGRSRAQDLADRGSWPHRTGDRPLCAQTRPGPGLGHPGRSARPAPDCHRHDDEERGPLHPRMDRLAPRHRRLGFPDLHQ